MLPPNQTDLNLLVEKRRQRPHFQLHDQQNNSPLVIDYSSLEYNDKVWVLVCPEQELNGGRTYSTAVIFNSYNRDNGHLFSHLTDISI